MSKNLSGCQRELSIDDFFEHFYYSSPARQQQKIVALNKKVSQIVALISEAKQFLAEYKKSLIFEVVTGKKQVSSCKFSKENSGKGEEK